MKKFFENISAMKKLHDEKISPVAKKYGLSNIEVMVLLFLADNPDFDTASDMVDKKHIAKSHVSMAVGKLESAGFITGEYADNDRRSVHLKLNPSAYEVIKEGERARKECVDVIFKGFSKEEIDCLNGYIARMSANVKG